MISDTLVAIYDFELFPYALGDVLTWNVRTAIQCEELGKKRVDIYICLDKKYPAIIYQRGLINSDNFELFFSELYSAFGTNPKFGDLHVFRQRETMLSHLQEIVVKDKDNLETFNSYLKVLKHRIPDTFIHNTRLRIEKKIRNNHIIRRIFKLIFPTTLQDIVYKSLSSDAVLNDYFIKYIHSHEKINDFAAKNGRIPLLTSSVGCDSDVDEIIDRLFSGKKIVPFHLRLRRLDVGYGGDHTYARDSNFLEWYDFLRRAGEKYPEVQFIALGRLQEKSLAMLRLPNVTSLRVFGMGLGHELTLMLKSDLFIGTSSGFAALANFSTLPYFITRMNPDSCYAYAIAEGTEKLPFASDNQKLVYVDETSELLMTLLEKGLKLGKKETCTALKKQPTSDQRINDLVSSQSVNVSDWLASHANPSNPARTTCRFYIDDKYRQEETAYLLLPCLEEARLAFINHQWEKTAAILAKLKANFAELALELPQYFLLESVLAAEKNNFEALKLSLYQLDKHALESGLEKIKMCLRNCLQATDMPETINRIKTLMQELNFIKV